MSGNIVSLELSLDEAMRCAQNAAWRRSKAIAVAAQVAAEGITGDMLVKNAKAIEAYMFGRLPPAEGSK